MEQAVAGGRIWLLIFCLHASADSMERGKVVGGDAVSQSPCLMLDSINNAWGSRQCNIAASTRTSDQLPIHHCTVLPFRQSLAVPLPPVYRKTAPLALFRECAPVKYVVIYLTFWLLQITNENEFNFNIPCYPAHLHQMQVHGVNYTATKPTRFIYFRIIYN